MSTATAATPIHPLAGRATPHLEPLPSARKGRAKVAYTARRVPLDRATHLLRGAATPQAGDLVLARVQQIGQHTGLQLASGRRATLFPADEVVVCYANRYAPDQFEGLVPPGLGPCHLVAAGGVAAVAVHRHQRMKAATQLQPLGLLADAAGRVLNARDGALPPIDGRPGDALVIAVVGTSMNAGKTTSAAHLIHGLAEAGLRVGAAKVTGTGAPADAELMGDAGALAVMDFTDAGFVSTYREPPEVLVAIARTLVGHLEGLGVDVIVIEVADGLLQAETSALLGSPEFREMVDGVVFAAADAMGAQGGVASLKAQGYEVIAVSGALTLSPLAAEEARAATGLPVLGLEEVGDAERVVGLLHKSLRPARLVAAV